MKYLFVGAGNMGGAAARAFAKYVAGEKSDVTVASRSLSRLKKFRQSGISTVVFGSDGYRNAVLSADIVFIVVPPAGVEQVSSTLAGLMDFKRQMVVCMAPGVNERSLAGWLGDGAPIAYAIPNTAIDVAQSMTFVVPVTTTPEQTGQIASIFEKVGAVKTVSMDKMISGTSLASCGIAYAMRYISASSTGGTALGFERDEAEEIVRQTVRGAVGLLAESGLDPEDEIDKVTTPGGMTLKGLGIMESSGFSLSVINALTSVTRRSNLIVVKIGSNVLTREDGTIDNTRMSALVDQIASLRHKGFEIILITSGAVASGRPLVSENRKLDRVQQRQLYSAVGQVRLMNRYYNLFGGYGIKVGQILTQKRNFTTRREFNNQKNCIEVMLQAGIIPIVNENDTICIDELMFTDNDELSGLVARMMGASALVLLSKVNGLYDADGKVIRQVKSSEQDKMSFVCPSISKGGRGGMTSKFKTAMSVAAEGIPSYIANGKKENVLLDLFFNPEKIEFTEFIK